MYLVTVWVTKLLLVMHGGGGGGGSCGSDYKADYKHRVEKGLLYCVHFSCIEFLDKHKHYSMHFENIYRGVSQEYYIMYA